MNCKNCNIQLVSGSDFCHKCGAKIIRKRLTLRNLMQHVGETFFNYDNKLFTTIKHLLKKPEVVIESYVNGIRKRYINPVSFFGISLTLTGFSIFIIRKFYKNALDSTQYLANSELYSNEASQQIMESSNNFSLDYSSLIYSAMIPVFALMSWILFSHKKYNYTEHLVTYMYSMSLYSITSVTFGLIVLLINSNYYLVFGMGMYVLALFYHCYLLKRLFNLSKGDLILRTILFLMLLAVVFVIITMVSAVFMLASMYLDGTLQQTIEAQKAAKGG